MAHNPDKNKYNFHTIIALLTLQSPSSRLIVFAVLSLGIFFAPYHWLAHLSLWQHIGIQAPSIGLTRAYWLLLHGDPAGAWERNALIFLVLAIGIPLLIRDSYLLMLATAPSRPVS